MINACLTDSTGAAKRASWQWGTRSHLTVVFVPNVLLVMQNVQQLNSIYCIYIVLLTQVHCTQQEQGANRQAYMWQKSHTRKDCSTAAANTVSTSSWLKPKFDTSCFSAPLSLWALARCSKPRWMRPSFSPWSCNVFSKSETISASLQTKQCN